MALFKEDASDQAFLKMGIYGNSGSGKTFTATKVAIGLAKYVEQRTGAKPPIMFLDTETGASWVKPMVVKEGIKFLSATTRAFTDLKVAVREAEAINAIMIVDSITHFWQDLTRSFAVQRKRRDNKLEFQDYGVIKPTWGEFTQAFLTCRAHIILCGRAGNTYDYQSVEQDDGRMKKELITTGTKMKAESEMGYEPSLLIEMFAEKLPDKKVKKITNKGFVWKDRSNRLNGHEFSEPNFDSFMPHIQFLNIGGEHVEISDKDSREIFDTEGRPEWQRRAREVEIVLDEIESILVKHYPGQSAEEKRKKKELLEKHFRSNSWKRIETFQLEDLNRGYVSLHRELEGRIPNGYQEDEIDDEIPLEGGASGVTEKSTAESAAKLQSEPDHDPITGEVLEAEPEKTAASAKPAPSFKFGG